VSAVTLALVDEATRRSRLVWVSPQGASRAMPVWHLWHDGRAYVVTGGSEQPLPAGLEAGRAVVGVRGGKDSREALLVRWVALVSRVEPGSAEWERVVPLLHAQRLNAPDGEQQPARWLRESTVLVLTPTGELVPLPDSSGAAPPVPTPATTPARLPVRPADRPQRLASPGSG